MKLTYSDILKNYITTGSQLNEYQLDKISKLKSGLLVSHFRERLKNIKLYPQYYILDKYELKHLLSLKKDTLINLFSDLSGYAIINILKRSKDLDESDYIIDCLNPNNINGFVLVNLFSDKLNNKFLQKLINHAYKLTDEELYRLLIYSGSIEAKDILIKQFHHKIINFSDEEINTIAISILKDKLNLDLISDYFDRLYGSTIFGIIMSSKGKQYFDKLKKYLNKLTPENIVTILDNGYYSVWGGSEYDNITKYFINYLKKLDHDSLVYILFNSDFVKENLKVFSRYFEKLTPNELFTFIRFGLKFKNKPFNNVNDLRFIKKYFNKLTSDHITRLLNSHTVQDNIKNYLSKTFKEMNLI
jgi:hypothetical protein